ncbi:MAG: hypothetical protein ABL308_14235 [Oceanicaulis sp.]
MKKPGLQLIIQDNWVRFTKQSRGADKPVRPPRLDGPARLPELPPADEKVWRHDRYAVEPDLDFREVCRAGLKPEPLNLYKTDVTVPALKKDRVEISLNEPAAEIRQTRWPDYLPSPIKVLAPGEIFRLDWNMRARRSLGGSHRGSFFEMHTIFITLTAEPDPRMFETRAPDTHVDLRRSVY